MFERIRYYLYLTTITISHKYRNYTMSDCRTRPGGLAQSEMDDRKDVTREVGANNSERSRRSGSHHSHTEENKPFGGTVKTV